MRVYDAILLISCDIAVYTKGKNGTNEHLFTISNKEEALHAFSREFLDKSIKKIKLGEYDEIAIYI